MRIDNDFLTLLDLTLCLHDMDREYDRARDSGAAGLVDFMDRFSERKARLNKHRDEVVAKINAADAVATFDPANDPDYEACTAFGSLGPVEWRLKKPVEGKPYTIANPANSLNQPKGGQSVTRKPRIVNYPAHMRPKDAAPAPSQSKSRFQTVSSVNNGKLWTYTIDTVEDDDCAPAPSQSKGHQYCVKNAYEAMRMVDRYGEPDSIELGHDKMTLLGDGRMFVLRWNVSPKDADGEGR